MYVVVTSHSFMSHSCASEPLFVVDGKLHFPILVMTPPPESTTAPPESNIVVPIAGAVAALGSVTIISFSIIITAIIVTRSRQARFELHKEET